MIITDVKVSNELLALAALSRPQFNGEERLKVAECFEAIDFGKFRGLLEQHRVWPTVYCNLKDHFPDSVPEPLMAYLKKKYQVNQARSRRRFHAHCQIIKALEVANIPVKPLKGIPLAQRLYGDFSLRHSSDIDILIHQNHVAEAHERLKTIGFYSYDYDALPLAMRARYFVGNKDISYKNKDNILLELHVRLCEFSTPLSLYGANDILVEDRMDAIREFMYLCWHASNSQFHRLKWLLDIALYSEEVLSNGESNAESLLRLADNVDERRSIIVAWVLSHIIFGTALPKKIEKACCSDRICRWLITRAVYNLEHPAYTKTWRYKIRCWFSSILLSRRWKNKWAKFAQRFRPNIFLLTRYPFLPENAVLLHYIFRLVDPLYRMIAQK